MPTDGYVRDSRPAGEREPLRPHPNHSEHGAMRANLKSLGSIELPVPLENYRPEDPENFAVTVDLEIGADSGEPGADLFQLLVCSPDWLKQQCGTSDPVWGRHILVLERFDFNKLTDAIQRLLPRMDGANWLELAGKISQYAAWEFEDYTPQNETA